MPLSENGLQLALGGQCGQFDAKTAITFFKHRDVNNTSSPLEANPSVIHNSVGWDQPVGRPQMMDCNKEGGIVRCGRHRSAGTPSMTYSGTVWEQPSIDNDA